MGVGHSDHSASSSHSLLSPPKPSLAPPSSFSHPSTAPTAGDTCVVAGVCGPRGKGVGDTCVVAGVYGPRGMGAAGGGLAGGGGAVGQGGKEDPLRASRQVIWAPRNGIADEWTTGPTKAVVRQTVASLCCLASVWHTVASLCCLASVRHTVACLCCLVSVRHTVACLCCLASVRQTVASTRRSAAAVVLPQWPHVFLNPLASPITPTATAVQSLPPPSPLPLFPPSSPGPQEKYSEAVVRQTVDSVLLSRTGEVQRGGGAADGGCGVAVVAAAAHENTAAAAGGLRSMQCGAVMPGPAVARRVRVLQLQAVCGSAAGPGLPRSTAATFEAPQKLHTPLPSRLPISIHTAAVQLALDSQVAHAPSLPPPHIHTHSGSAAGPGLPRSTAATFEAPQKLHTPLPSRLPISIHTAAVQLALDSQGQLLLDPTKQEQQTASATLCTVFANCPLAPDGTVLATVPTGLAGAAAVGAAAGSSGQEAVDGMITCEATGRIRALKYVEVLERAVCVEWLPCCYNIQSTPPLITAHHSEPPHITQCYPPALKYVEALERAELACRVIDAFSRTGLEQFQHVGRAELACRVIDAFSRTGLKQY
ncbi:unnamed protein product [Closterium sp. Naga37s-1]|nr:unnamed protein product [Closterium sp. Naga37s-1]